MSNDLDRQLAAKKALEAELASYKYPLVDFSSGGEARLPVTREVPKQRLHWLQTLTYFVVILTCLLFAFIIFDIYYTMALLQNALNNLGK